MKQMELKIDVDVAYLASQSPPILIFPESTSLNESFQKKIETLEATYGNYFEYRDDLGYNEKMARSIKKTISKKETEKETEQDKTCGFRICRDKNRYFETRVKDDATLLTKIFESAIKNSVRMEGYLENVLLSVGETEMPNWDDIFNEEDDEGVVNATVSDAAETNPHSEKLSTSKVVTEEVEKTIDNVETLSGNIVNLSKNSSEGISSKLTIEDAFEADDVQIPSKKAKDWIMPKPIIVKTEPEDPEFDEQLNLATTSENVEASIKQAKKTWIMPKPIIVKIEPEDHEFDDQSDIATTSESISINNNASEVCEHENLSRNSEHVTNEMSNEAEAMHKSIDENKNDDHEFKRPRGVPIKIAIIQKKIQLEGKPVHKSIASLSMIKNQDELTVSTGKRKREVEHCDIPESHAKMMKPNEDDESMECVSLIICKKYELQIILAKMIFQTAAFYGILVEELLFYLFAPINQVETLLNPIPIGIKNESDQVEQASNDTASTEEADFSSDGTEFSSMENEEEEEDDDRKSGNIKRKYYRSSTSKAANLKPKSKMMNKWMFERESE